MGVVTAATSLIDALVKKNPEEYKGCVSLAVSRLSRIVTSSYTDFQVPLSGDNVVLSCTNWQLLIGLYLLLCARSLAVGQAASTSPKLPTP